MTKNGVLQEAQVFCNMTSLWCIYPRKQEAGIILALLKKNQIEQAFRRLGELALLML
jgi:hypothetical protein